MHVEHPLVAFAALLAIPLALRLLRRAELARAAALGVFGELAVLGKGSPILGGPGLRRRNLLRVAALALGALALARPQWGVNPALLDQAGRDLLVLLDLSRSMLVSDLGETRLEAAKRAVTQVLQRSPGSRVGLVVFGGSAFLQLPLTTDRNAVARYLAAASPDDLGDPSTDIEGALTLAARTFEHAGDQGFRTVLLVSDGESGGEPGPAVERLGRAGIPVLAVGVGTVAGGPVPADASEAPERWHRDHIGRIAQSRLEEETLRKAAAATGGTYTRWDPASGAVPVADALVALRARRMEETSVTERADRFQWPLVLMLAVLMAEPLFIRPRPAPEDR
jgi:Ca-activated chloride channel homolog